jgi:hypothetical protein
MAKKKDANRILKRIQKYGVSHVVLLEGILLLYSHCFDQGEVQVKYYYQGDTSILPQLKNLVLEFY